MHNDALGCKGLGIKATERKNADEAIVVDVAHDEADFVHVSGTHDGFGAALALDESGHVANVIYGDFICERGHHLDDEVADAIFKTGSTGSFAKLFEKLGVHRGR